MEREESVMERTNAIVVAEPDAIEASPGAGEATRSAEPYFEVFVAMQKRGLERRLDAPLVDLITDRAMDFAALTPREQAALAWVEAVISSGKTQSSDGAYAALRRHFDDAAIAKLTALAGTASARAKLGAAKRG
jgi:hypothetical protein